jgi:leucyl aminopeptidase (aminopeptidase T)
LSLLSLFHLNIYLSQDKDAIMNLTDAFKTCLDIKEDETVLLLTDSEMLDVAGIIRAALFPLTKKLDFLEIAPRGVHGEELPPSVAAAMDSYGVVVGATSKSMTHTMATKNAVKNGARVASMPGISVEMLTSGGMTADYVEVSEAARKVAEILSHGKEIMIKTSAGTNFRADITGRKGLADTGLLTEKGVFGNLPGGEGFIAPVEGTSEGRIVFDGPIASSGLSHDPIVVEVEGGRATDTNYSELADVFVEIKKASNVGEIGIGVNPAAKLIGNILEDEKVLGTAHVAFGSNTNFGGSVDAKVHLDGIIKNPTVLVDGKGVVKEGSLHLV